MEGQRQDSNQEQHEEVNGSQKAQQYQIPEEYNLPRSKVVEQYAKNFTRS